jgi:hypothetical protein
MKMVILVSRWSSIRKIMHREPRSGVERAEGFVEKQDAGARRQGLRDGEALLHAARERGRPGVAHVPEADAVERGLRAVAGGAAGGAGRKPKVVGKASAATMFSRTVMCGKTL